MKNVMLMKQNESECLTAYYKWFTNMVDIITKTQWALLVPTKAAQKNNDKEVRQKFLACIFLTGVDQKQYSRLIGKLKNQYLTGQKNYPNMVEAALTMLSHYMEEKHAHRSGQASAKTSFVQLHKEVQCYKCGKKGHYANKCQQDSNSNLSSEL